MVKRLAGTVVEWDDERGFGFVGCGSARVFLHRREFAERRKPIEMGDRISFTMGTDAQGRACAKDAAHVGNGGSLKDVHVGVVGALLILPGIALARFSIPWLYAGAYFGLINLLTFLFYAADKRRARRGVWRIAEAHLHLLEFLGGWPAAFLAQRAFRHKSSKRPFQVAFWLIVAFYQIVAWSVINDGAWVQKAGSMISKFVVLAKGP